jgi:hypothetical protein
MMDSDMTLAHLGLDTLITLARAQGQAQVTLARDLKLTRKQLKETHDLVNALAEALLSEADRDLDEEEPDE